MASTPQSVIKYKLVDVTLVHIKGNPALLFIKKHITFFLKAVLKWKKGRRAFSGFR